MAVRLRGNLVVMAHGPNPPADDEWAAMLEQVGPLQMDRVKVLVCSFGGAPNTLQRGSLRDVMGEAKPHIALLTTSVMARAAGVAIAWFQPHFKALAIDNLEAAYEHLQVPAADRPWVKASLVAVCGELGTQAPFAK
jgi:hypothetical protein